MAKKVKAKKSAKQVKEEKEKMVIPFREPSYWKILQLKLKYSFFHWKINLPTLEWVRCFDMDELSHRELKIVFPREWIENTLQSVDFNIEANDLATITDRAKKFGLTHEEYICFILEESLKHLDHQPV